jgi:hypothetical protein
VNPDLSQKTRDPESNPKSRERRKPPRPKSKTWSDLVPIKHPSDRPAKVLAISPGSHPGDAFGLSPFWVPFFSPGPVENFFRTFLIRWRAQSPHLHPVRQQSNLLHSTTGNVQSGCWNLWNQGFAATLIYADIFYRRGREISFNVLVWKKLSMSPVSGQSPPFSIPAQFAGGRAVGHQPTITAEKHATNCMP